MSTVITRLSGKSSSSSKEAKNRAEPPYLVPVSTIKAGRIAVTIRCNSIRSSGSCQIGTPSQLWRYQPSLAATLVSTRLRSATR